MTLNSDSVKHERKTLVRMVHKSQRGELEPEKVDEHHNSWKNNADKGNSYKVKQRTQKYLKQLRKGEEHGSKKNDSDTCGSGEDENLRATVEKQKKIIENQKRNNSVSAARQTFIFQEEEDEDVQNFIENEENV